MKRLPEAVTTKFTELFAALHSATDDLKMTAAEACLIGDFSQVTVINDSCRKLQTLESEIKATVNNFDARYNARGQWKKPVFTQRTLIALENKAGVYGNSGWQSDRRNHFR